MSAGQLLIVGFEGRTLPNDLAQRLREERVGGTILFARNLGTPAEVAALVDAMGAAASAGPPPIVSIDQEGGRVQRLKAPLAVWPPMATVAARGDERMCEAVGRGLGEELRLFGFNVDYAPVLDVRSNPANQVIGDRAFGSTPETATRLALAFWRGLEASGMRGCGKHFPGHGDTVGDSHLELPRLDASIERLRAVELPPFVAAVRAGMGMLMTAHVVFSAVDDRPATLSHHWIQRLLREDLGFRGVVLSDDLDMKAVADHYPVREVIFEALAAGVDAFLACRDPEIQRQAEQALDEASRSSALAERVTDAQKRLRQFRTTLAPVRSVGAERLARALPDLAHEALADSIR